MGKKSRTKGATAERQVAELIRHDLREWLPDPDEVRRNLRQYQTGEEGDLGGVPGWSIEVKRYKETSWPTPQWWGQTWDAAKKANKRPALWLREDRGQWKVAISAQELDPKALPEEFIVMHATTWLDRVAREMAASSGGRTARRSTNT